MRASYTVRGVSFSSLNRAFAASGLPGSFYSELRYALRIPGTAIVCGVEFSRER